MRDRPRGIAEDYTKPALVMGGVNLFLFFAVLWVNFGLALVFLIAAGLNHLISRRARRQG